jgi:hypothetical protein
MRRLALAVVTLAAASALDVPRGEARSGPWCVVIQDQNGGWACGFQTFEQCLVEARSGNTGFCAQNPAYQAPARPVRSHKRRQPR